MSNDDRLALEGGPRAVTVANVDHYPQLTEAEIAAVVDCMRKGAISIGDGSGVIGELERELRDRWSARATPSRRTTAPRACTRPSSRRAWASATR